MIEEQIPTCEREERIDAKDDAKEVCFEGANHALGDVAAVHVRWHFLVLAVPIVGEVRNVGGAGFIVQDLQLHCDTACLEALHDVVVCWNTVCIGFIFE